MSPLAHQIDRSSPLPLYAQIKRRLQQMIVSWPADDDRFHSDHELCASFGVSRATIRQALSALEQEGLLRRVQGFGTFVNRPKIEEQLNPQMDFSDQWARSGRALRVEIARCEQAPCPQPFAAMLGLAPQAPVLEIERIRLSGNLRIAYDRRYIVLSVSQRLTRRAMKMVSLLDALSTVVELDRGDNRIEAGLAGDDMAERLEVLPHDPVLVRQVTYFTTAGEPVMAGVSTYRADQVRYAITVPVALSPAPLNAEIRPLPSVGNGARKPSDPSSTRERKSG